MPLTSSPAPPRQRIGGRQQRRSALIMMTPAGIGLVLFVVVPFVTAIWLSTQFVQLNTVRPPRWVGFEQYHRLFLDPDTSPVFWRSLRNNVVFAAVVVPLQTAAALGLALLLNQKLRGMSFYRTFIFMPIVFPMALVAVIWKLMYSRSETGMLNDALHTISFGVIGPVDWLGDPRYALASIVLMSLWQGVGFQTIILLAGLQGISPTLYEAASIDRAGAWSRFVHVTLPGLRNTLALVVMVTSIFAFRLFDQIYVLTPQGGPSDSTTTLMFQAVQSAFQTNDVGRGAAITVVLFVIVVVVTIVQRLVLREDRAVE